MLILYISRVDEMRLAARFKNNPNTYITLKLKGNPKKISDYKKAFSRLKKLEIIDEDKYLAIHEDCLNQNLDVYIHYLFYGVMDDDCVKQSYINPLFDLNYYKQYTTGDALIDYVLYGFFKKNRINDIDNNYVNTLEMPLSGQFIKNYIEEHNYITDKRITVPYIQSTEKMDFKVPVIGVFTNDSLDTFSPCFYIRIYALFLKLAREGEFKFLVYGMNTYADMNFEEMLNAKVFDIVVVQRILPFLDSLTKKCLNHKIKLVYETDDDLLGVEVDSPSFEYVDRVRSEIERFIDSADIVSVTTHELSKKFEGKKTVIVPNYYVSNVYDIKKPECRDKLTLGYFGTLTHTNDLMLVKNAVLKLKESYDFDFEIVGGFNEKTDEDWFKAIEIPPEKFEFDKFMKWISKTANWDIALIPLENTPFNQGKSELKFIELSVLGIPGVYSDMVVYNSVIKDSYNGMLAGSDDEWIDKIELLINNKELRKYIACNGLKTVLDDYSMDSRVDLWRDIFRSLTD